MSNRPHVLPRFPSILLAALALVLGMPASAEEEGLGHPMGTIPVPGGLSVDTVRDTIAYSFAMRGWTVKEKTDDRIVGYLNHRGREANLTTLYSAEDVSFYVDGWALGRDGSRRKRDNCEGWVENLKRDIVKRLNVAAATQ